jgi:hypothetical protein
VIRSCQHHFMNCEAMHCRCCVANALFTAELFRKHMVSDRVIMGVAHRVLFGHPPDAAYAPTNKDILVLVVMLASVGALLDVPPSETHVMEMVNRIKQVKTKESKYTSLLDLLCWCRVRKWDAKLSEQIIHAVHRCVAVMPFRDSGDAIDDLSAVED